MDRNADIVTANGNQQTSIDPDVARANIVASAGAGESFDPDQYRADSKAVIIVGGGRAEALDAVVAARGGVDSVAIVAVGSAALRLNVEAQDELGYPSLAHADAIVVNEVYSGAEAVEHYAAVAAACRFHDAANADSVRVYLASYGSAEAFSALPQSIRVSAVFDGTEGSDDKVVVGLGSTASTAAVILGLIEGRTEFDFVGVTGASLEDVPEGEDLSVASEAFADASAKPGDPERYPDYKMPEKWQKISPDNKVVVYVGENQRTVIPPGQWYQLQEMKRLVEYGRAQGMSFTFYGENSLSKAVLMGGLDATVVYAPEKLGIAAGATISGVAPPVDLAPKPTPDTPGQ